MTNSADHQTESAEFDQALDWLINWAMGADPEARDHFFHICDGTSESCGCKYAGEA